MSRPVRFGAILAAGEGRRLRRDGFGPAKPLVAVAGVPLVAHAIENLFAAGVERLVVAFNQSGQDCAGYVREHFPARPIEIVLGDTASSFETFRAVSERLPPGRVLVTTVDAWCPREDFVRFSSEAADAGESETVLAVTPFVDDERPLWVETMADGLVRKIGGATGTAVTAGAYLFSGAARLRAAPARFERLRAFLAWLIVEGETVRAVTIEKVIDVDRGCDVAAAEEMSQLLAARGGRP
ncbi:MAG: NTP transferase domain-containing protein [Acidobacteriota bacterium]